MKTTPKWVLKSWNLCTGSKNTVILILCQLICKVGTADFTSPIDRQWKTIPKLFSIKVALINILCLLNNLLLVIHQYTKVVGPAWNPFQWLSRYARVSQKNFQTGRSMRQLQRLNFSFGSFCLLKWVKMAIFEVILWASWRSTTGLEAIFPSSLT